MEAALPSKVQSLERHGQLAAKRDLELPRMFRKLDNFDLLVIDDLGYLPQGAEESEVLFTLIAERYERRSLGITSNMVFSEWEKVFANPMATAAAIDRIVHHSVILHPAPETTTYSANTQIHWDRVSTSDRTVRVTCAPSDGSVSGSARFGQLTA